MATVAAPIDATSTAAWKALEAHQEKLEAEGIDLKAWFAADAERVNKLSFDAGDLHFDLSKNLVTDETVKLPCDLAREVKLEERRDAMFSCEHIFSTEDRAVLHTALRRPVEDEGKYIVDGGLTLRVCPYHPNKVLQTSELELALRETQTQFYALDTKNIGENFSVDDGCNILKLPV